MNQKIVFIMVFFSALFFFPQSICAQEYMDEIMDGLDLYTVDGEAGDLPEKLSFADLAKAFVEKGTDGLDFQMVCDYLADLMFYELSAVRPIFIEIICISLLFALYGKVLVTGPKYVSQLGFFVVYTGILMLLLESFSLIGEVVENGVGKLVQPMRQPF